MIKYNDQSFFELLSNSIITHSSVPINTIGLKNSAILNNKISLPFLSPPVLTVPCPSITCIIPFFPNHNYYEAALKSIFNQSIQPDNIILCIDGDSSIEWNLSSSLQSKICILRSNKRVGPYKLVDQAIRSVDTELIWFHDSDDMSHPWRLQLQLAQLLELNLDAVGTGCLYFSGKFIYAAGLFPHNPRKALQQRYGHVLLYPTLLIKRQVFLKLGGFSDFASFGMDSEFSLRLCFFHKVRNLPWTIYYKRQWNGALTLDKNTGFGSSARENINLFTKRRYQFLLSAQEEKN